MDIEYYILNPIRLNKKKKLDWFDLWINKSDYIIKYCKNIRKKYDVIDESIDYYITMIDVAIYYLQKYSNYYSDVYIQHNIILDNETIIKEDIKERDFSEYLKYLFYKNYDISYIYKLIDKGRYKFNYYLVVARMLYPSYYFYYLERVIINNKDFDKLEIIVSKTTEYEKFVKQITNKINEYLQKKIVLPF